MPTSTRIRSRTRNDSQAYTTTRRRLLRAGGASALACPLLRAFGPTSLAQAAAPPRRLIVIYSPNGTVKSQFWPESADPTEKPILKPLAPFRDQVIAVKGLGYSGFNIPHEMGTSKALTNFDAFGLKPAGVTLADRQLAGPSLDEALSRTVGAASFRPVLRVGKNGGGGLRGAFNFTFEGKKINSVDTTSSAFEYLFGPATGATPMVMGTATNPPPDSGKLAAWREVNRSVLDVITQDANALKARLPAAQKGKMDAALEAIRSLERNLQATDVAAGGCSAPAQVPETESAKGFARVIAGALACDMTRIVSWKLQPCADVNVLGVDFHSTSHNTGKPEADAKLTEIHTLFATQIGFLVNLLKNTLDPKGAGSSLLDNTVIYWANECAHGNHDTAPLPITLIGSAGGYFKTGRLLTVDKTEAGKYGNLLVSLANAIGDPRTTFGDPRWCTGPLSGLAG